MKHWLGALLVWLCLASAAEAHPLSPAALSLVEYAPNRYAVRFTRPLAAAAALSIGLPAHCRRETSKAENVGDQRLDRFNLHCPRSLEGQTLRLYGLVEQSLGAIVYVAFQSGETVRALLSARTTSLTVPARSTAFTVFVDYLLLGLEHLVLGLDHVLFVLGLFLLCTDWRRLVLALSAFTLGHSVTLALSTLELVTLPQAWAELGIALSLVLVALQIVRSRTRRLPTGLFAGLCGLLHGLGFAGALHEIGFAAHAVALSLLGFNLGVELGQLALVALLVPLLHLGRTLAPRQFVEFAGYAIGSLSAMWCIERALALA